MFRLSRKKKETWKREVTTKRSTFRFRVAERQVGNIIIDSLEDGIDLLVLHKTLRPLKDEVLACTKCEELKG